eukprot:g42632.t1
MKQRKIADKDTSLTDVVNDFYARFEQNASGAMLPAPTAPDAPVPTVTAVDIRSVFLGVNPRKAMGLDRHPGLALRSCADQLAEVFTNIFNLFLLQAEVLTRFKKTTIIPVPKTAHAIKEAEGLVMRCNKNNLSLNIGKTKEPSTDFRKKGREHIPIYVNRAEIETMESVTFLGVTITNNLSWTSHVDATIKAAQQCLFFHRQLRKFGMSIRTLTTFTDAPLKHT